jgi:hypothetical protein
MKMSAFWDTATYSLVFTFSRLHGAICQKAAIFIIDVDVEWTELAKYLIRMGRLLTVAK